MNLALSQGSIQTQLTFQVRLNQTSEGEYGNQK